MMIFCVGKIESERDRGMKGERNESERGSWRRETEYGLENKKRRENGKREG